MESLDASSLLTIRLVEASVGQTNFTLLSAAMVVTDSLEESRVYSMLNTALIRSFTRRMSGKVNETLNILISTYWIQQGMGTRYSCAVGCVWMNGRVREK